MATNNGFNVTESYHDDDLLWVTMKGGNETPVLVQAVEITDRDGVTKRRVEVRRAWVSADDGVVRSSKDALIFRDDDELSTFIDALVAARDDFSKVKKVELPTTKKAASGKRAAAPKATARKRAAA